jgi:hypothetical protein
MDDPTSDLIPPPGIVRERLARNYEDADLLRRLLRLSESAALRARSREDAASQREGAPPRTRKEVGGD